MKKFISLLLDTNDNGNTVFLKERKGKDYIYLAAEHTSNDSSHLRRMTKEEVIANKDFLTNVGISGDRIYPITDLQYRKVLPKGFTRCEKCGFVVRDDDIWCEDNGTYLCEECHNSNKKD